MREKAKKHTFSVSCQELFHKRSMAELPGKYGNSVFVSLGSELTPVNLTLTAAVRYLWLLRETETDIGLVIGIFY